MRNCDGIERDEDFYDVDKKTLLEYKSIEKRLSCNFLNYDYILEEYYLKSSLFLISNFYSLFNYITGEFTPNISANIDESGSWCSLTENKIQLGTKLLSYDLLDQQGRVDTLYAVMLHEMFHKRFTNKEIVREFYPSIKIDDFYSSKNCKLDTIFPDNLHLNIFNILEDYRIEKLGLREFPGYVFYFDVHRKFAIEMHKRKQVDKDKSANLIMEYLMFKILMPELLKPFKDFVEDTYVAAKNSKKKKEISWVIKAVNEYVDMNTSLVYSDSIMDILTATNDIYRLIPKKLASELSKDIKIKGNFEGISDDFFIDDDVDGEVGEKDKEIIGKAINKLIEAENKKNNSDEGDLLTNERVEYISIIGTSVGEYNEVVIYSPKCKNVNEKLFKRAKKISNNITRSLGFLASRLNQVNNMYEQMEGDLDETELYSISYNNDIFYEQERKPGFELDFGILLDESGSMSGEKIENAIVAALSYILSIKDSVHINLFVYGHSQGRHKKGMMVEMYEYYNKYRNVTEWRNIFSVSAMGGNADGYAIAKMGEIMLKDSQNKNKVLVVVSDGAPSAYEYSGIYSENHVRDTVQLLEKKGFEIIQICIDNVVRSPFMFKNFIPYDSKGNFIKSFSDILNKKLMKFMENF